MQYIHRHWKKSIVLGGTAALASALMFVSAYAQPDGDGFGHHDRGAERHHRGGDFGMRGLFKDVDLSADQKSKIDIIMKSAHNSNDADHRQHQILRMAMLKLMSQPTIDTNAVERLRQQQVALHEAQSKRMSSTMVQAFQVLTPQQRAKVTDLAQARFAKYEQRRAASGKSS